MQQRLPGLTADITRSRVIHKLFMGDTIPAVSTQPLKHKDIVAQPSVSAVEPYHTALLVIAAGSALIIFVLTLLILLYRKKVRSYKCEP